MNKILNSANIPVEKLLKSLKFHGVPDELSVAAISLADDAMRSWSTTSSNFLSPSYILGICTSFRDVSGISVHTYGGYPQAEKRKVFFDRIDQDLGVSDGAALIENYLGISVNPSLVDITENHINLVEITGNFVFNKLNPEEFADAIVSSCNVRADELGDIITIGDRGCQVLVDQSVTPNIVSLDNAKIGGVLIQCKQIPLLDIAVRPPVLKEMSTVEQSIRLDAIVSAAFGLSRSKISKLVVGGDVLVDWKVMVNPAYNIQKNQMIFMKGHGRVVIQDISKTSKDRFRVKFKKMT